MSKRKRRRRGKNWQRAGVIVLVAVLVAILVITGLAGV
jgi:hypothetical protein